MQLIEQLLQKVGMKRNFEVMECEGMNNCKATSFNGTPLILYDAQFLAAFKNVDFNWTKSRIPKNQPIDWTSLTILAHEIGHHTNQHIANKHVRDHKTPNQLELEADEFAGYAICRMGGSLAQAQKAFRSSLVTEKGSYSHPPRNKRLAAIKRGWESAGCSETVEVKVVVPTPPNNPIKPKRRDFIPKTPEGMVFVKGGSFMMGCIEGDNDCQNDEKPRHEVVLDDFYIGKYEVTNAEYCDFLNAKGKHKDWLDLKYSNIENKNGRYTPKSGYAQHPVVAVTWYGADAYAKWKGMRLPTEAEWEYAARSRGQNEKWAGTSSEGNLHLYGNYSGKKDRYGGTAPVGSFQPNDLGIYDMSGNVWEWCSDGYDSAYYQKSPKSNPENTHKKNSRSLRGGSWSYDPSYCRTSDRSYNFPTGSYYSAGFRLAQ